MKAAADYPQSVRELLFDTLLGVIQPVCVEIDRQHHVVSWCGQTERYGLKLSVQQKALLGMPWLAGIPLDRPQHLPRICLNRHQVCDLRVVPFGSNHGAYVVLSVTPGASPEVAQQQSSDKVRILTYQLATVQEQLQAAKADAAAASELKSQFIAGMSHEFRSPLTSILGYCELLEKKLDQSDRRLQGIRRSSNHLLSLVENLLEHGRVVTDKIEPVEESIALARLFESLNLIFEPLAEQKKLTLEIVAKECQSPEIISDPVRLRQVLVNLISNAIRYTDEGWVRVIWQHKNDQLQVAVADSGIGIPADQRETIFQAFCQLQGQSEGQNKGLGLGLSISRHLAEVLGGRIDLESSPGKGSTFILHVRAPAAQPTQAVSVEEAANSGQGRILVVEDDMDVREFLAVVLRDWGYVPLMASTTSEAMEKVDAAGLDLILTDMKLAGESGQSLIRQVHTQHPKLPLIAMSASNAEEERSEAFDAGCSAFLIKPFELEVLLQEIVKQTNIQPQP